MAGSKSVYLELAMLDHVFGGPNYARPSSLYIALFTAAPTSAGGGTECSGGSYSRCSVTNNTTNFPAASGSGPGTMANGTAFTFPQATASWGTVVAFAVFDAASAGNMLYWGLLTTSRLVATNDT